MQSGGFAQQQLIMVKYRLQEGSVCRVFDGDDIQYIGRIITNQNPVTSITEDSGTITITQMNGATSTITLPSGGGGGTVLTQDQIDDINDIDTIRTLAEGNRDNITNKADTSSVPNEFVDLDDTPSTLAAQGGKFLAVNSGGTAVELVDAPSGGGGSTATTRNLTASGSSITLPADYTDFTWVYIALTGDDNPTKTFAVAHLNSFAGNSNNLLRIQGNSDCNWNPVARTLALTRNSYYGVWLMP